MLQDVRNEYLERFNILKSTNEENPKGEIVNQEFIEKEIEYLKKISLWNDTEIKVYFIEKVINKNTQVDAPFLNSFFLDDLNRLIDNKTELSLTLQNYLTLKPTQKKFDLIKNKQHLFNTINPKQLTEGKWPSTPQYGLCTAQLGAVNTIFKDLKNSFGLQGVNGPPGTGKTTLLLDVIAQIVVDRAKKIINIGIDNIFGEYEKVSGYIHTYKLHSALQKNYGIVVASNNNSAVENISKELPQAQKINKYGKNPAFSDADYFAEYAKGFTDEENWGILAVALGNSKNKNKFYNNFWKSFTKDENNKFVIDKSKVNFYNYLEANQDTQEQYLPDFEENKKEFNTLLSEFKAFKNIATEFHNRYGVYSKNTQLKKELNISKREKEEIKRNLSIKLLELKEKKDCIEKERDIVKTSIDMLNSQKPAFFFFHKLFNTQLFINWNNKAEHSLNQFYNTSTLLTQAESDLKQTERKIDEIGKQIKNIDYQLNQIANFEKEYLYLKKKLCEEYEVKEENIFDKSFNDKDLQEIHLLSPYHSKKIAELRSRIFLKALDIHKYAILANAKELKNNLNAFFEMIFGRAKVSEELTTTLWDSFFFCVPVVSTSLASASKLFPNMIKNQIGWLLIDEAGQATPQSAVGLIQRSKRCVIVGDPLQVEPVVTIPKNLVDNLMNYQFVEETWSPYNTSVKIWTGFPLRTHRRCFSPMFDIANKIAYNNQMVKGIKDEDKLNYIGSSCWFDVQGSGSGDSQVIKEEIDILEEKVKELRASKYEDKIYVISPFKLIANECRKVLKDYKKVQCGTIHTFQGKEADVVFIVLGIYYRKQRTME